MEASAASLFQRFLQQDSGHVGNLDVHLKARDARTRAGHLEIHIAVVVFGARDIGEDGVIVALLHHSHRDSAT